MKSHEENATNSRESTSKNNYVLKGDVQSTADDGACVIKSDLVWQSQSQSHYNNCLSEASIESDEDDLSFQSANTSNSNSRNITSTRSIYNTNLDESFMTYAHDSIVLPPSSVAAQHLLSDKILILEDKSDYDDDDDESSFASAQFSHASCSSSTGSKSDASHVPGASHIDIFSEQQKQKNTFSSCHQSSGNTDKEEQNNNSSKLRLHNNGGEQISPGITLNNDTKNSSSTPNSNTNKPQKHHKKHRNKPNQVQQPTYTQSSQSLLPTCTIQSLTFNQDKNCIAIATSTGYRIRSIPSPMSLLHNENNKNYTHRHHVKVHQVVYPPISPMQPSPIFSSSSNNTILTKVSSPTTSKNTSISSTQSTIVRGHTKCQSGISHIQILHSTSVIAIVKNATPRILSLLHAKTTQCIVEIPFTNAIRRIEMNMKSLVVLTAEGLLHVFRLKGTSSTAGGTGGSTSKSSSGSNYDRNDIGAASTTTKTVTKTEDKGIELIKTIQILHNTESTRMITADNAKTSGAFFDLSTHLFSCQKDAATSISSAINTATSCTSMNDNNKSSWLITKSYKGIGYVSVYKTTTKTTYVTQNDGKERERRGPSKIVKMRKECLEIVDTFQAHKSGIIRIAIGGASNSSKITDKIFATTSLKVRKIVHHVKMIFCTCFCLSVYPLLGIYFAIT